MNLPCLDRLRARLARAAAREGGDWSALRRIGRLLSGGKRPAAGDPNERAELTYGRQEMRQLPHGPGEMAALREGQVERLPVQAPGRAGDLRVSETRLAHILDSAAHAIIALDEEQSILSVNRAAEKMFGYRADEVVAQPFDFLLAPGFAEAHREQIHSLGDAPEGAWPPGEGTEVLARRKDGSEFPAEVRVSKPCPGRQSDNGHVTLTVMLRDVTDRKRTEEALAKERDMLRTVIDNLPDYIYVKDTEGRFLLNNTAHVRSLGAAAQEDALGKTDFHFFSHELAGRAHDDEQAIIQSGQPLVNRERARTDAQGNITWVATTKVPWRDSRGSIVGIVGLSRDITERKQAEEALAKERDLLQIVIDNLPDYIYVKDTGSRFLLNNAAHIRALGAASQEEVLGRTDYDFFPEELAERYYADEQAILRLGQPLINREQPRVGREGGTRWVLATKVPWRDSSGKIVGIVGLSRDITERKQAEEKTQRQLQQVQALRMVDQAINASLDLRLIFEVFLDQVTSRLAVDAAAVLVFDPRTQTLEYAASRGFRSNGPERSRLRLGEGHAGRAALERRMISVPDLAEAREEFAHGALLASEGFVAYLGLPLIAKGQVKGVLEIFHRAHLVPDADWLDFLETLAGQAAIAIDNASLFEDLQRSNIELRLAYDTTLEGWSRLLDLRDERTEGHTQRVTQMTLQLARAMGMSEEELVHVRRGALLHDIGKMGIPDSILHKPGPLTEEEWKVMRQHPVEGCATLRRIGYLRPALDIIYCHHERWDGTGYPRRLKGEQIPLAARIFSVADAYDAMTSDRPYRPAMTHEEALAELRRNAGTQFDPGIVELFLQTLEAEAATAQPAAAS